MYLQQLWAGVLSFSSCAEDFLKQKNTYQLGPDNYYDSDDGSRYCHLPHSTATCGSTSTISSTMVWAMDVPITSRHNTQITSTLIPTSLRPLSRRVLPKHGVTLLRCITGNNTINNLDTKCTANVSETAKIQGIAEARFMRGLAYWYIGTLWGCGIIYNNTSGHGEQLCSTGPSHVRMCIEFAIRDMEYAAKHLPAYSGTGACEQVYRLRHAQPTLSRYGRFDHQRSLRRHQRSYRFQPWHTQ